VERAAAAIRQGPEDVSGRIVSGDAMALRPLWEACDMLYRDLPAAQRRLFRLLAVPPTTEIGTGTAAAVAGITPRAAAELLDGLARRGLIESGRPGRYRIRQMLVTSARRFLEQDSTWRVNRATVRLVRYYATIAEEYADQLLPTGEGQERDRELAVAEARAWFRQEREVMFRMVTAGSFATSRARSLLRPGGVTPWLQRLAIALCTWYAYDGQLGEWQDVCEAVLAGRIGPNNRTMEFWARNELGTVYRLNGDPATGAALLNEAAELCAGRYHRGLGQARTNHGLALLDLGDVEAAIRHLDAGLALRPHSDRHGRAVSALGLGVAYLRAGELTAARQCLIEATNHFDEVADTRGTAAALNNLGAVLWEQQDHTGAREHWAAARERFARLGDQAGQSAALLNVAAALLSAGHGSPAEARDLLLESLTLTTARPATRSTGLVHLHLGDAYRRCGDPASARTHWEQALRVLASVGDPAVVDARQRLRREART